MMTTTHWMGLILVLVCFGAIILVGCARTTRSEQVPVQSAGSEDPSHQEAIRSAETRSKNAPAQSTGSDLWSNSVAFRSPDAVGAYTTALLSIVALEANSVILVEGQPVPRLEDLTHDQDLLAWKAKLPPNYADQLTAEYVMGFIIGFAKWPSPNDRAFSTELRAKLVKDGGIEGFKFKVNMTTVGMGKRHLEIRPGDVQ